MDNTGRVAIIGGGICGLTAALRLTEAGFNPELFEAAPHPGGRTRSFEEHETGEWCDNGPHLLNGAYVSTQKLLADCNAENHVSWQSSLCLPFWDPQRGAFALKPASNLPVSLALPLAINALPDHDWRSVLSMLRLHLQAKRRSWHGRSVAELMDSCGAPEALLRDLIEPICLGAMNESLATADAASFARVVKESFSSAESARLGWFNRPLQQALIEPLTKKAVGAGATIHCRRSIRTLQIDGKTVGIDGIGFDRVILALPAYARDRLLNSEPSCDTRAIINLHLWYNHHPGLSEPFIGGIATRGQWYFDITQQMGGNSGGLRHLCAVISGVEQQGCPATLVEQIGDEIARLTHCDILPFHHRLVVERRATVLVRPSPLLSLPDRIIDACEQPEPGALPATIESAVQRGEQAANMLISQHICD